ncbi:MAG: glycosyltransferase [Candidatus Micrarchaeaceae archaeon]
MDYNDFTVVLPTLNEGKSIGMLIRRLLRLYNGIHVIVVDDGSHDSTMDDVKIASGKSRSVRFIDRAAAHLEKGLTGSVVDGILAARTKFVVVMDADLQHPPEIVGKIAKELAGGADLAVAVRAEVKGWALHRKIISKTLISLGYLITLLRSSETSDDIFSGFFGVDRRLFDKVYSGNRKRFVMEGYKVLFDFLKCMKQNQVKISEVPYSFGIRKHGASKAGFRQGIYLFKSFFS